MLGSVVRSAGEQTEVGHRLLGRGDQVTGQSHGFGGFVRVDGLVGVGGVLDLAAVQACRTAS